MSVQQAPSNIWKFIHGLPTCIDLTPISHFYSFSSYFTKPSQNVVTASRSRMPLQKASLGRLSVGGWGENIPLHGNTVGRRWWEWWVGSEYFKYSEYSEYSEYSAWEYYWEEISGVTSGFRVFRWVAKSALARPWHRGNNQGRSRNIRSSSTFPDISQHHFSKFFLFAG